MGYGFCGGRAYLRDEEDEDNCIEYSNISSLTRGWSQYCGNKIRWLDWEIAKLYSSWWSNHMHRMPSVFE